MYNIEGLGFSLLTTCIPYIFPSQLPKQFDCFNADRNATCFHNFVREWMNFAMFGTLSDHVLSNATKE